MTYAPFMQLIFDTRPVAFLDGVAVVAAGVAMLVVVEIEKAIWRSLSGEKPPAEAGARTAVDAN
jgi:hypothetical protein